MPGSDIPEVEPNVNSNLDEQIKQQIEDLKQFDDAAIYLPRTKNLADLPLRPRLDKDGRVALEEDWAGRGFNSWPYLEWDEVPEVFTEDAIRRMAGKIVPLTYTENDENGEPRTVQIGTAMLREDGAFVMEHDERVRGTLFPGEMSIAPKE